MVGREMLIVISYDIANDRRRVKVAKLLEAFGVRVLESVFESDLTMNQWKYLDRKINRLIDHNEDKIRVYFICAECAPKIIIMGCAAVPVEKSPTEYVI